MASTDARPVPRKNAAFRHYFAIRKNNGTLITTWAGMDSEVSLDGAAFSDCTNEATEIGTSGCGYIDLTSSEMNADAVMLKVTVTNTDALPLVFVLFPEEVGDYRIDASALATAASITSLDGKIDTIDNYIDTEIAAIKTVVDDILVDTGTTLPSTLSTIASYIDTEIAALPTAAGIADAVWDEAIAGHLSGGSTGAALNGASSAGDPWTTTLPGAYSSGTAGFILGTNLNATVSSRASQTSLDTLDDYVDTEIAAIKAKTDNLPADPADASDIASSFTTVNTKLDTIDDFLDTEIAAIKAKTDSLTFTVAGQVDANIQYVNDVQVTGDGQPGTEWGP